MAKGLSVPESELSYSNEIDDLSHHERVSVLPPKELALSALTVCIEQKAHDPCAIELTEGNDVADYFVLASATSERHARGIADNIQRTLKAEGETPTHVAGYEDSTWIVLDYGDVVIHVFHEPVRRYYDLDGLWGDAPRLPLAPELHEQVKKLRTGMFY